jgi:hypothetical protein
MELKRPIILILWCVAMAALAAAPAYAAPDAGLRADITDVTKEGGELRFNLNIAAEAPTENYSSLDFSLVSDDPEHLYIDKDPEGDSEKNLLIAFPDTYGSAYHKGRLDDSGAMRHLIGIFSQSGQNDIGEETEICSVSMVYSGDGPATLSLEGLQLVYIDEDNAVQSVKTESGWSKEIDGGLLTTIRDSETPLAGLAGNTNLLLVALLSCALGAAIAVAALMLAKRRKT